MSFKSFYSMGMFFLLQAGVLIGISSMTWFGVWVGLELGTLSFICLGKLTNIMKAESGMKYFLIQSSSSFVILCSSLMMYFNSLWIPVMMLSLALKLGLAPLHFWVPMVSQGMSWFLNFNLFTVQKFLPFFALASVVSSDTTKILVFFSLMSGGAGSLMGWNELCLRKLMSFSSINHSGWMAGTLLFDLNVWAYYWLVYSIMIYSLFYMFDLLSVSHLGDISSLKGVFDQVVFSVLILSLMGLPPFLGFSLKWLPISVSSSTNYVYLFYVLLVLNVFLVSYYLRLILVSMVNSQSNPWSSKSSSGIAGYLALALSLGGLFLLEDKAMSLLHEMFS